MEVIDVVDKLAGPSIEVFSRLSNVRGKSVFFQPYHSYSDATFRGASILCAPVVFAGLSAGFAAITSYYLVSALFSLVSGNLHQSDCDAAQVYQNGLSCLQLLFLSVASPFINAVDAVGGGINTLTHAQSGDTASSYRSPY